jgi:hypothetical protein
LFRNHRSRFIALITGLLALALGIGLTASAAASASTSGGKPNPCPTVKVNGVNGGGKTCPTPTPTPSTPTPTPTVTETPPPVPVPVQQDFDLDIGGLVNPAAYSVLATGDFAADLGHGVTISPVLDRLINTHGSINVHHEMLSGARVDHITCTITVQQNDLPWYFLGGTGAYRHLRGVGFYTLRGVLSFPTVDFGCPALAGLTNRQADRDLNSPTGGGLNPDFAQFDVQAAGVSFFTSSGKVWTDPNTIMHGALTR